MVDKIVLSSYTTATAVSSQLVSIPRTIKDMNQISLRTHYYKNKNYTILLLDAPFLAHKEPIYYFFSSQNSLSQF